MPYKNLAVQREYQRKWMADRRADALADAACGRCGSSEGPFDFHHIDPFDKVDHKVWSWSPGRRAIELKKCVILCRPCHVGHHQALRPTHCKRGHELTEENSYWKPGRTTRECWTCKRARAKESAQRKAAA